MFRLEIRLKTEDENGQEGFPVSKVYVKRALQPVYLLGTLDQISLSDWNGQVLRKFSSKNIQVPDLFSPPYYSPR